jgi:hypothetical protein
VDAEREGIGTLTVPPEPPWLTGCGVVQAPTMIAKPAMTLMRSILMARLRCVLAGDCRSGRNPRSLSSS